MATTVEEDSTITAGTQQQTSSGSSNQQEAGVAAVAAAAASSREKGIQVVQVLPWADAVAEGQGDKGEVLLELDGVSINTPDGGLALVQNLSLKVSGHSFFWHTSNMTQQGCEYDVASACGTRIFSRAVIVYIVWQVALALHKDLMYVLPALLC
jgi:hypothetical protein